MIIWNKWYLIWKSEYLATRIINEIKTNIISAVLSSRDIDFLKKFPILTFFCKKVPDSSSVLWNFRDNLCLSQWIKVFLSSLHQATGNCDHMCKPLFLSYQISAFSLTKSLVFKAWNYPLITWKIIELIHENTLACQVSRRCQARYWDWLRASRKKLAQ